MTHFILQNDDVDLNVEFAIVKELLDNSKHLHSYEILSLADLENYSKRDVIPIGSIQFVSSYLKNVYNIDKEIPIEIPTYL